MIAWVTAPIVYPLAIDMQFRFPSLTAGRLDD
jgi:hypothetical protein